MTHQNYIMKKWKVGLLFWIFVCLAGSLTNSLILSSIMNSIPYFYFSISDVIWTSLLLIGISMIYSLPIVLTIRYFLKTTLLNQKRILFLNFILIVYSVVIFVINTFLTNSIFESFYIITPYIVTAVPLMNFYLLIENRSGV